MLRFEGRLTRTRGYQAAGAEVGAHAGAAPRPGSRGLAPVTAAATSGVPSGLHRRVRVSRNGPQSPAPSLTILGPGVSLTARKWTFQRARSSVFPGLAPSVQTGLTVSLTVKK